MKSIVTRLIGAALFIITLTLYGCGGFFGAVPVTTTTVKQSAAQLTGYWKSAYGDGFEIVKTAAGYTYTQYDDAAKSVSFAGDISGSSDLSAANGYIIVKITQAGTWGKTVNEYFGIYYKEMTASTVKQSSAYKSGGKSTTPTASEASAEFTTENGYYAFFGDYTKQ